MLPGTNMNPMAPYFRALKANAANIPQQGEHGDYTADMLKTDFPQFFNKDGTCLAPEVMLNLFINQANDSVLPSRWGTSWRYAAGLYTAHFLAMYLKTYAPASESASQAADKASQVGVVKNATMGDTSITYDNSAVTAGTEKWGTWNATQYGSQLVTMARQIGMGGMWCGC